MVASEQRTGLSLSEVLRRQSQEGFNELPQERPRRLRRIVFEALREPVIYLLIGCCAIYFTIGDQQEAAMLLGFLLLIVGITVFEENRAERALEALRDLSSPRALVLREGMKTRIPGREVVRGDIVFISEGDRVPADANLLSSENIAVDESLLTGESVPVSRAPGEKVHAGSMVVRGHGSARVSAVGVKTEIGQIGKSLLSAERERTALEAQIDRLVVKATVAVIILCVFVTVVYALTRGSWLNGSLVGLTLAMAVFPNELPAVLTIFFALGAWRLSERKILTRRLPAVENLGATTVLCVDKTGTLTVNQMRIRAIYSSGQHFDFALAQTREVPEEFHEALEFGILASQQDPFDPMEQAFLTAGGEFLIGTEHLHADWQLEREYPLSPELLALSHAWKPAGGGGFIIGAKGAPEAIFDLCHLPKDDIAKLSSQAETMAASGLRVIGVAKAVSPEKPLPTHQHAFDFEFVGLIGLADPVRPEVPAAVAECRAAGIRVVMLTGDHPVTAAAIAREIGLPAPDHVLTGAELRALPESQLRSIVKEVSVFSRVTPDLKLKLVEALKAGGEIVAMTGDGVNDAPALKSAHIGIAMGGRGTDVARESAAIVLLNDDFGSIVESVRMGRRVYANLKGAMIYLLAVHLPIAGMSVLPVVMNLPLVLLPAHIALLHLIIEPASAIVFETEPADSAIMNRPPHPADETLFGAALWMPTLLRGGSVFAALAAVYFWGLWRAEGEADARALVFTTLMFANLMLIAVSRGAEVRLRQRVRTLKGRAFGFVSLISLVFLALVLSLPETRRLFGFSILHVSDLAICALLAMASVMWLELGPLLKFRKKKT